MTAILSNNSLIHAIQTVAAMSRMLEAFVYTSEASTDEKAALGELISDMDSTLDNLTTVYAQRKLEKPTLPDADDLMQAYSQYAIKHKA